MSILQELVIREGLMQAAAGAHYVKCGFGHHFDAEGNVLGGFVPGREAAVHLFRRGGPPSWIPRYVRFAAWSELLGHRVCAGRCSLVPQDSSLAGNPDDYPPPRPGSPAPPAAPDPTTRFWRRPLNYAEETRQVFGDCCIGRRHFDCIGFVNWCFWTAFRPPEVTGFTSIHHWRSRPLSRPIDRSQVQAGDILFADSDDHIGIAVSPTHVVHAAGHTVGVMVDVIAQTSGHAWDRVAGHPIMYARSESSPPVRHEAGHH
jgi:preprotein translocase subunit Sec61beta